MRSMVPWLLCVAFGEGIGGWGFPIASSQSARTRTRRRCQNRHHPCPLADRGPRKRGRAEIDSIKKSNGRCAAEAWVVLLTLGLVGVCVFRVSRRLCRLLARSLFYFHFARTTSLLFAGPVTVLHLTSRQPSPSTGVVEMAVSLSQNICRELSWYNSVQHLSSNKWTVGKVQRKNIITAAAQQWTSEAKSEARHQNIMSEMAPDKSLLLFR